MQNTEKKKIGIKEICLAAMMTAVITVCSWLSLPVMTVPVTLQTFAIFLTLLLCGGKNGTLSILVYILLGLAGVPVFSGFRGGISALFGLTGGYIIGFLLAGVIFLASEKLISQNLTVKVVSLMVGLAVCYTFGTLWFIRVYNMSGETISFRSALSLCVFPFLLPDMIKLVLAIIVFRLIEPTVRKISKT